MSEITPHQALRQLATGTTMIIREILWAGEWRETLGRWFLAGIAGSIALTGAALHPWLWPVFGIGWMAAAFAAAPELANAEDDEDQDDADDEPTDDAGEPDHEPPLDFDDFIDLVHEVAAGGNVHLTAIGAQLAAETGRQWDVLALCRAAGIPTRAVRVPGADPAVTTGIHRRDLPPLPQPLSAPPVGVVAAGQHGNNNNDNMTKTSIGEGAWTTTHGPTIRQEARR